jgi:hypothetical protein
MRVQTAPRGARRARFEHESGPAMFGGTAYRMLIGLSPAAQDAHVRLPRDTWAARVTRHKVLGEGLWRDCPVAP